MDELICRFLKGSASKLEERELLAWRRAAPQNEAYYRELEALLELAEHTALDAAIPPPPAAESLLRRARRGNRGAGSGVGSGLRNGRMWGSVAGLAAAAVALLLFGVLRSTADLPFPALVRLAPAPQFSLGVGEFVTGGGESATVVLADGTVVRLAPESRLRILQGEGSRQVFLHGKAYFAVASMEGVPFRIRTRADEVVVLGTRFEVQTWGDRSLRVVVLEGRVALGADGTQVEVEAGEMSLVSEGTRSAPVRIADVKSMVPWLDRFIVFQSTPLHEVARELEREYRVRVQITDSVLADQLVTGWYADRSFEDVLAIVCGVLHASCSLDNGVAKIGSHPTPSWPPPTQIGSETPSLEE